MAGRKAVDILGRRFDRLLVMERKESQRYSPSSNLISMWEVKCDCGNVKTVSANSLLTGRTRSCGCLRKERALAPGVAARNEVLGKYKKQAINRKLSWKLSEERFDELTSGRCHYCGLPPSNKRKLFAYSGIDRKNSTVGYVEGNVVPCCKTCNWLKGRKTYEAFTTYLARVGAFWSEKKTTEISIGTGV
jgi:hypothetical protein